MSLSKVEDIRVHDFLFIHPIYKMTCVSGIPYSWVDKKLAGVSYCQGEMAIGLVSSCVGV